MAAPEGRSTPAVRDRRDCGVAIRSFSVGPMRGLIRAEADGLGNLVVLAGPNGAGKSSLLDLLRQQRHTVAEPGTEVMFVGPHRTWRSSQLNRVSVYGFPASSFGELLKNDAMPHFQYVVPQGLQGLQGVGRQSSSADDVQAFVKTSLVRLRDRQQALVTQAWQDQGGRIEAGTVPQLFEPFQRLVHTLLPHLEWVGVTDDDPNNIQCRFRPAGADEPVFDIDELSSGEKAAVALLLPFVERQADQMVTPRNVELGVVPLTMLLDEPEIHLHPLLQLQVLQYLRDLASEGAAQFILATQSPTLLDALNDDELYLLSPAALRPDNQLSRLSTSHERLEVARGLTGSTHLLTRAKPIVFVEGETERPGVSSDARLITLLLPETRGWALVPGRSKHDVVTSVQRLRQDGVELPGAPVFGLVDADRDTTTGDDHVVAWPVAMVENLLLDTQAIYEALRPYGNLTTASSTAAVQAALENAAQERIEDEVRLRVQRQLPVGRLEIHPDRVSDADAAGAAQVGKWLDRLRALDVTAVAVAARVEVESIIDEGVQLERFHGKRILQAVYKALNVTAAGLSQPAFALAIADRASSSERVQRVTAPAIGRIKLYFPAHLADTLRSCGDQTAACDPLVRDCNRHHAAWAAGRPEAAGREQLREQIFAFARTTGLQQRRTLTALASEIGTA